LFVTKTDDLNSAKVLIVQRS